MKKLSGLLVFIISTILIAVQFSGHQSISTLGGTYLFTAPASGIYFIDGRLYLPQPSQTGGAPSQVIAQVSKNGLTALYTGVAGANGFNIPAVALVSNDSISVSVTSNATVDQGIGTIKGDVFFGNAF